MKLPPQLPIWTLLGLLAACSSSTSSSSGGEDSPDPVLSFSLPSSSLAEESVPLSVQIQLDEAQGADIEVGISLGGTADEADYTVTSTLPVTIQAGELSAMIDLEVIEDIWGEIDESIEVTLIPPSGVQVGAPSTHVVTIVDDDENSISEVEPNNDYLEAQDLFNIFPYYAIEVVGSAVVGEVDVYKLTALGDHTVHVSMDPDDDMSEVVINLLDKDGQWVETFDGDIAGTVSGSFDVGIFEVFFLEVTVEAAEANYVLDIVGV
jgi:hypothetical protein